MTTYTIVDKDKDPLGPNEINADEKISVSDGDTFIIDPSANGNITFEASGGVSANFDIQITSSNANSFSIKVESDLAPSLTIGDNVDLTDISLDAMAADAVVFNAGDNVSFGKFEGSTSASNTVVIGDGFTTGSDWKFGDADDSLTVGNDATFQNLDAGAGDDTVTFGDRATVHDFDTKSGNDSVTFGDDLDGNNIKTSDGDDIIRFGKNAQVNSVDGGGDSDALYTETVALNEKNIESSQVVCYAPGTHIDTPNGWQRVDTLRVGDLVMTLDEGPCPVRWVRSSRHLLDGVSDDERAVLIRADALGCGRPAKDLIVSPQHRILVGGGGQLDDVFDAEYLVPSKALTKLSSVCYMRGKHRMTWVHFALDRHQVVRANGCLSESLYLGPMVVKALRPSERLTLQTIYGPSPKDGSAMNGPASRPFLTVGVARRQIANYVKDRGDLVAKDIGKWKRDLARDKYEAKVTHEARRQFVPVDTINL